MFGWKQLLKEWFEGWEHSLKPKFRLTRNANGDDGIGAGGYIVAYVYEGRLRLLYRGEYPEYLNAADKELFNKLGEHLVIVYDVLRKKGWLNA